MEATGISCAKTLADKLDIPLRTIQRLKLDCATAISGVSSVNEETPLAPSVASVREQTNATSAIDGVLDAPLAPDMAFLPSRVLVNNKLTNLEDSLVNNITPLSPPKAERAKRGSRLPDDWQLPDDWRQWTLTTCPASTPAAVATEALKFANYWQAKGGKDAAKVDWRKTWQNWSLTAFGTAPARPRSQAYGHEPNHLTKLLAKRRAEAEALQ
jgi:hypothetical protein